jgi:predicted AlkP superfamily phosphohydrolase/phosphomutase
MASPTVLFIGLDSADPALLDRWTASRHLPNLAALSRQAVRLPVQVPEGFSNGCAWPSLYTGMNPGGHGRYGSATWLPGTYDFSIPFDEDRHLAADPFWLSLSDKGVRVGITDMVRAPLTPALNGFQIADWLTHDRRTAITRSWPEDLARTVVRDYGGDTLGQSLEAFLQAHDLSDFCTTLIQRIETKARQTVDFARDCDLYMTTFGEPHDAGHMLWQFHDPDHPDYDAARSESLGEPLRRIYMAVDVALGRILDRITPRHTLIFAGPGMGPNYTANNALRHMLAAIDLSMTTAPRIRAATDADRPRHLRALARALAPPALRQALRRTLPDAVGRAWDIGDMAGRRFFPIPHTGFAGAIRINLRGREPAGCVAPGAEYDQVCTELAARLRELRNAETGEPLVSQVVRVHETCHGPALDRLPDLMVVWERSAPIRRVSLPGQGEFEAAQPGRRGDHNSHAVLYSVGQGGPAQASPGPIRVEDLAPTITTLLGLEAAGFDGRVAAAICSAR